MILVDTSVWSLAFRRNRKDLNPHEKSIVFILHELIIAGEAVAIDPVRQELLSGITNATRFKQLQEQIEQQINIPLATDIWILAAELFNTCLAAGITADDTDMTICAAAVAHAHPIFTTDPDFTRYATVLPIKLFKP